MPPASSPLPPERPAPLQESERDFIVETVRRFYGTDAVIRNFGPLSQRLELHVEADARPCLNNYDCLGMLFTRLVREHISLEVTTRGTKPRGRAKIAYRQGEVL